MGNLPGYAKCNVRGESGGSKRAGRSKLEKARVVVEVVGGCVSDISA